MLGVTLQTVRRDVQRLSESGLLTRFHGGVRVPSSTIENIAHQQRETLNAAGKGRIARAVAGQVPNDCSLIINIGTTTEAIAKALLHHTGLRVITNNLNVAAILSSNPQCEVIVAGGLVRPRDRGIIGEAAVDFIRQFKVDIALIGISGIEADGTLRDFDYREVKVAQTIIAHSREVWLAADASKFNRAGDGRTRRACRRSTACSPTLRRRSHFPNCWPTPKCSASLRRDDAKDHPNSKANRMTYLLALDQGTSSSRSIVFDAHGQSWRWPSRNCRRSIRSPAGSSTTRWRSGKPSWPRRARRWPRPG